MSQTQKQQDPIAAEAARIAALVDAQRAALRGQGPATAAQRTERIDRAIGLLVDHEREICEAVRADFGSRSIDFSRVTEVLSPIMALKHARAHLAEPDADPVDDVAPRSGDDGEVVELRLAPLHVRGDGLRQPTEGISGNPFSTFTRPALFRVHLLYRLQGELGRVQSYGIGPLW